ncbi:subtilisin-like protease SBT5.6 [Chenopodium quinoa]|uniref:Subtilisin-like protease SBT5.6 n=1 Tax=Chenopodium quinoa TaxID=63459 RepID=A0A803MDT1_CHEQI|nr:subtilisin-like protease SBT5.6 [Chenopodium quinoa]
MKIISTFFFLFVFLLPILASSSNKQVYIVYFGVHKGDKESYEIEEIHHSYLSSVKETEEEARASMLYSYKHSINGFAATLTPAQASNLSKLDEVVSVFESHPMKHKMHTTRSWQFVGLEEEINTQLHFQSENSEGLLSRAKYGHNVIVGVLDSGFWPESKSYSDDGMGPIPKSWKGICQTGDAFNSSHCNRKVIGARYYIKAYESVYGPLDRKLDYLSPRDKDGHGTHTSSTVGGRTVPDAAFMGELADGTASGGAPLVQLAIYKVCWAIPGHEKVDGNTCFDADMLAAMDDAINDGVHVMSISIGTPKPVGYSQDGIAIGALHAVKKGIVVSCSAGNSGPHAGTLSNTAPWIITVGASSLDREFSAPIVLGNGMVIQGQTTTTFRLDNITHPLVYAGDISLPNVTQELAGQCLPNSLSSEKAGGNIVFCLRGNGTRVGKGMEVMRAGGIGYILGNAKGQGEEVVADPHVLPATAVGEYEAVQILNYIKSTRYPAAKILPATTVVGTSPAPFMASFTSRGPNVVDPTILKPDITAPGLNILAAWSEEDSPTKLATDDRRVQWNIYSGTSMSCPHVSAAAALLKAVHPTWSSAAIRSALMTTAGLKNNNESLITDSMGNPADAFQYGAGHFRPTKAADPGLVYDATYTDYLTYLCSLRMPGFDPSFKCPQNLPKTNDLNQPSLAISKLSGSVTVTRTVTNVGKGRSYYFASVKPPTGYKVNISPSMLIFRHKGQKKSFSITVEKDVYCNSQASGQEYEFGWLTWFDGFHTVRSPIAVSSV